MNTYKRVLLAVPLWTTWIGMSAQSFNQQKPLCCSPQEVQPAGLMWNLPLHKNRVMFQVSQSFQQYRGMQNGFKPASSWEVLNQYVEAPTNMAVRMSHIMVKYGITRRLSVMAMGHYMDHSMTMDMFHSGHQHGEIQNPVMTSSMKNTGWGDVSAAILWKMKERPNSIITGLAGLVVPTGNSRCVGKSNDMIFAGKLLPYAMQMGSGSWQAFVGWNSLWRIDKNWYGLQGEFQTAINANSNGLKPMPSFGLTGWAGRSLRRDIALTTRLQTHVGGGLSAKQPELLAYLDPMANPSNYGSMDVSGFIGAQWSPCINRIYRQKIAAEIGHTALAWYNGYQLKTRLQVVLQYSIHF